MTFEELREQSKRAVIARLQDDNVKLEFKFHSIDDTWDDLDYDMAFDLKLYHYRVKKPTQKYRVGIAGGVTHVVDNEAQANMVENYSLFERWITDWVEYEA